MKAKLTEGKVGETLFNLTVPMIFGILSIVAFNLADTYFVGRLGTAPLAALSFTFPVVFFIGSIALGLGTGASAVISRAIGEGNHHKVERLVTDSLILSFLLVVFFATVGFFTINPLFRMLGATKEILPLISQYMSIWYLSIGFVVIPMVGNNAIRAAGDTKTPSTIMVIGAVINIILDPIFIFGFGIIPRLEIVGAAIATVIARAITFIVALYVLYYREKMITFEKVSFKKIVSSWKKILYIALPTAGTRAIIPVAIGVVTRLISTFGVAAVAAYGVATRIEFFAMSVLVALSAVLSPFVGQNWGARIVKRVKLAVNYSNKFAIAWGIFVFIFLAIFAEHIALLFNSDPEVVENIVLYLRIVTIGFGFEGILMMATSVLNVLNKPIHSAILMISQMFFMYVPFAFFGAYYFGVAGLFFGISISYILAGIIAYFVMQKQMAG